MYINGERSELSVAKRALAKFYFNNREITITAIKIPATIINLLLSDILLSVNDPTRGTLDKSIFIGW